MEKERESDVQSSGEGPHGLMSGHGHKSLGFLNIFSLHHFFGSPSFSLKLEAKETSPVLF